MPKGTGFQYDPDKLGAARFIGKVTDFREMTAQDFDDLRNATLSQKVDPESQITYLEVENLSSPESLARSTFFMADVSSVSKWAQFIQALNKLGIRIRGPQDLVGRVLEWEEGERERGKYGKGKYLEPIAVPTPDELAALVGAETPVKVGAKAEGRTDSYLKNLIIGTADGLTQDGLMAELEVAEVVEDKGRITKLCQELVGEGKMKKRAGKFEVV